MGKLLSEFPYLPLKLYKSPTSLMCLLKRNVQGQRRISLTIIANRKVKRGKRRKNREGMDVLKMSGRKIVKNEGHDRAQWHWGSCQIFGTRIKSAEKGHDHSTQHGVAVLNFWVKFPKCRILEQAC